MGLNTFSVGTMQKNADEWNGAISITKINAIQFYTQQAKFLT